MIELADRGKAVEWKDRELQVGSVTTCVMGPDGLFQPGMTWAVKELVESGALADGILTREFLCLLRS